MTGIETCSEAPEGVAEERRSIFWRHYVEMLAVMGAGMAVTSAVFLSVVGLSSWDDVTRVYPTQCLLAMAGGMTVPMVGWMVVRGMGWRNSYEMAVAMVLPVVPFLCLVWFGIMDSALCLLYCAVTLVSMYLLMRHRRLEYSTAHKGVVTS